jgi:hypothetical protein
MSSSFNWDEMVRSKRLIVKTNDKRPCGNLMAECKDNIIIEHHITKPHEYMIPKSKVVDYNASEVYLDLSYETLSIVTLILEIFIFPASVF